MLGKSFKSGRDLGPALMAAALLLCLAAGAEAQTRPQARPASAAVPEAAAMEAAAPAAGAAMRPHARPDGLDTDPAAAPEPATETDPSGLGPETGLPLPRYVSLKADEANVRRGPSQDHRIDWVFVRRNMPLMVTAEFGHWRRVEDSEGMGGWMHYALLSGSRYAQVTVPALELHNNPNAGSMVAAELADGVIARIDECAPDWCRLSVSGFRGWALKTGLWGVGPEEVFD